MQKETHLLTSFPPLLLGATFRSSRLTLRQHLKSVAHGEIKNRNKTRNCFSLIGIFFNTAKLFQCFSFRDVRTSEIKLQLNNAAGGRLYFRRPRFMMCDGLYRVEQNGLLYSVNPVAHREIKLK